MKVSPLGVARLYRNIVGLFVLDKADERYVESIETAWNARDRDRYNHDHARARRRSRQSGSARA